MNPTFIFTYGNNSQLQAIYFILTNFPESEGYIGGIIVDTEIGLYNVASLMEAMELNIPIYYISDTIDSMNENEYNYIYNNNIYSNLPTRVEFDISKKNIEIYEYGMNKVVNNETGTINALAFGETPSFTKLLQLGHIDKVTLLSYDNMKIIHPNSTVITVSEIEPNSISTARMIGLPNKIIRGLIPMNNISNNSNKDTYIIDTEDIIDGEYINENIYTWLFLDLAFIVKWLYFRD